MKPNFQQRLPIRPGQPIMLAKQGQPPVAMQPRQTSLPPQRQTVNFQSITQQQRTIGLSPPMISHTQPMRHQSFAHGNNNSQSLANDLLSNKKSTFSIIYNESKTQEIPQPTQTNQEFRSEPLKATLIYDQKDAELKRCHDIIKHQNESLKSLQEEVKSKVTQLEAIQTSNTSMLKEFQQQLLKEIQDIDINLAENDFTKLFLQELDRKASNLQNNVNSNIEQLKDVLAQQKIKVEQLCSNVACNIGLRIEEDENHFKGELAILRQSLAQKVDRNSITKELQSYVRSFKHEVDQQMIQLKAQHQASQSQVIQDNQMQVMAFQQRIEQIEKLIISQITELENRLAQQVQEQNNTSKEKAQLQSQIAQMKQKFSHIQALVTSQKANDDRVNAQLKAQNSNLQKQVEKQKEEITLQKNQIQLLEQQITNLTSINVAQREQTVKITHLSPLHKHSSISQSFLSGGSLSTRPEIKRPSQNVEKFEINLDDFADFNENSLSESVHSSDSMRCEFIHPQMQQLRMESPAKPKPHSLPKALMLIKDANNVERPNKKLMQAFPDIKNFKKVLQKQPAKERRFNPSAHEDEQYNTIVDSIRRRMRYINKPNEPLECIFSDGHLSDTYTSQNIVSLDGEPLRIDTKTKNLLIREGLITILDL